MATERESYLICDGCGVGWDQDGYLLRGETDACVRDKAKDECGWAVGLGSDANEDYCPECRERRDQ